MPVGHRVHIIRQTARPAYPLASFAAAQRFFCASVIFCRDSGLMFRFFPFAGFAPAAAIGVPAALAAARAFGGLPLLLAAVTPARRSSVLIACVICSSCERSSAMSF